MRLIFVILLFPFTAFGQFGFTASLGYSEVPVTKFDFSYTKNRHSVIATLQPNLTSLSKYPAITAAINYGYLISTWQPYVGYSTQGITYGVNKYINSYVIGAGMQGKNPVLTFGVTTLQFQGKELFTGNDYAIAGLQLLSGFAMGLHESIQAGHWGKGSQFWDNTISWKNKYKADGVTARFPGSTTWAVSITDGYHLTNLITNTANIATLSFAIGSKEGRNWKVIAKKVLIGAVANRAAFHISYNNIFK